MVILAFLTSNFVSKSCTLSDISKGSSSFIFPLEIQKIKITVFWSFIRCLDVKNGSPYSQVTLLFVFDDISSVRIILVLRVKMDWSASLCRFYHITKLKAFCIGLQ